MHFQCNTNNYFQSLFISFTISIYFVSSKETCDENVIAHKDVFEYQDNLNSQMGFLQENGKNELETDFLYFPRVAKTGSNFIINLLLHLDEKNEFVVVNFPKENEVNSEVLPGIISVEVFQIIYSFFLVETKL